MDQQEKQTQAGIPPTPIPETPQVPEPTAVPPVAPMPSAPIKMNVKALTEKYNALPKNTKLLIAVVGITFAIIIVLLIVGVVVKGLGSGRSVVSPTATPSALPVATNVPVEISNPSKYATDSGVLKIESDVDNLTRDMSAVDLKESDLRIPTLDMNVKF